MAKYYRVLQDTFIWDEDAILQYQSNFGSEGGYRPIEDIWNKFDDQDEYISTKYIEQNPKYFQRVYRNKAEEMVFLTAHEMKKLYNKMVPEKKEAK